MRSNEEQNARNRQFSAKISQLHLSQKNSFRKLFESGIEFNWKDPKIIKLICQGIPSVYRARVWPQILENYHGINLKYYESLLKKAEYLMSTNPNQVIPERARTIAHLNKIQLDIERTYPDLKIFLKESQQGQCLFNLLSAWIVHRQDVGYIQGMSQIAGLLLLELKEVEAFALFCSVITTDVVFMYQNMDINDIELFQSRFERRVKKLNEELFVKLKESGVETRSYLLNWILTLFTRTMSLDMVSQLWDILFIYGISSDVLIEVGYYLLLAFRKRLSSSYEAQELIPIMKGLKLNDLEAHSVLCNLREFYRCFCKQFFNQNIIKIEIIYIALLNLVYIAIIRLVNTILMRKIFIVIPLIALAVIGGFTYFCYFSDCQNSEQQNLPVRPSKTQSQKNGKPNSSNKSGSSKISDEETTKSQSKSKNQNKPKKPTSVSNDDEEEKKSISNKKTSNSKVAEPTKKNTGSKNKKVQVEIESPIKSEKQQKSQKASSPKTETVSNTKTQKVSPNKKESSKAEKIVQQVAAEANKSVRKGVKQAQKAKKVVAEGIENVGEVVEEKASKGLKKSKKVLDEVISEVPEAVKKVAKDTKKSGKKIVDESKDKISKTVQQVKKSGKKNIKKASKTLNQTIDSIKNETENIVNGTEDVINATNDSIDQIPDIQDILTKTDQELEEIVLANEKEAQEEAKKSKSKNKNKSKKSSDQSESKVSRKSEKKVSKKKADKEEKVSEKPKKQKNEKKQRKNKKTEKVVVTQALIEVEPNSTIEEVIESVERLENGTATFILEQEIQVPHESTVDVILVKQQQNDNNDDDENNQNTNDNSNDAHNDLEGNDQNNQGPVETGNSDQTNQGEHQNSENDQENQNEQNAEPENNEASTTAQTQ